DVHRKVLGDAQDDVLSRGGLEVRRRDSNRVCCGGKVRQRISARRRAGCPRLDAGGIVDCDDCGARHNRAGRIQNGAVEGAYGTLGQPCGEDCREAHEKSDPLRALAHRSLPSILRIISTFNLPTLHSLLLRNRPCVKRKGRTKAASAPPESMEVTGGPSGTGWPFGPSACHTYCSLPNVTIVTGPEKNPWRPPLESSNATR